MSGSSTVYTVDSTSPILRYSQEWRAGNTLKDEQAAGYSDETFTVTIAYGATMGWDSSLNNVKLSIDVNNLLDFTFNGTSILIAGAKRPNHGPYSVTLDGQISNSSGFSSSNVFQTPLFQANSLNDGLHNVKLTNLPVSENEAWLDVDFVKWTSTDPGLNAEFTTTQTVEDDDPSFSYQPSGSWSVDMTGRSGFSSSNGHIATSQNAQMAFNFTGTAVQLIGSVGPDHGNYDAWVDGTSMGSFSANRTNYAPQQTLFFADNLGNGSHTLKLNLKAENPVNSTALGIDCAFISGVSTEGAGDGPSSATPSNNSTISKGAIAGITLGAISTLLLIITAYCVWRRMRQDKQNSLRTMAERGIVIDGPSELDPGSSSEYMPQIRSYAYQNRATDEVGSLVFLRSDYIATREPQPPGTSVFTPSLQDSQSSYQSCLYISGQEKDLGPAPSMVSLQTLDHKQALNGT